MSVLLLVIFAVCNGQISYSPEDCMATPLSGTVYKDFQEAIAFGFGPLMEKISGRLIGRLQGKDGSCNIMILWNKHLISNISFDISSNDQKCHHISFTWKLQANWELLHLRINQRDLHQPAGVTISVGSPKSYLQVSLLSRTYPKTIDLRPPFSLEFSRSDDPHLMFFNCPAECQVNSLGLDELAGRTNFYISRDDDFSGVKLYPQGLEAIEVLSEQLPVPNHWYEVDVQSGLQSIKVTIDHSHQLLVPVSVLLPRFDRMKVTLNGSAKVSWCQRRDPERMYSQIIAPVIILCVLTAISVYALLFRNKINGKIKKAKDKREREARTPMVFAQMPYIMATSDCPPPAPAPCSGRELGPTGMNAEYSEPHDGRPQEYTLPENNIRLELNHDEQHKSLEVDSGGSETSGIGEADKPYDKLHGYSKVASVEVDQPYDKLHDYSRVTSIDKSNGLVASEYDRLSIVSTSNETQPIQIPVARHEVPESHYTTKLC